MIKVYSSERRPIKSWVTDLEDGALDQAKNLANLPFLFKHVSLMPDAHQGYGMPIGGVIATKNVIIPNAVGVDIGCGVLAIKTDIPADAFCLEIRKEVMGLVRKTVPVGFERHEFEQNDSGLFDDISAEDHPVVYKNRSNALMQIGTLGGGNHFIEFQSDGDFVWVMIHSGSRNLGHKVAIHYNTKAIELNLKYLSVVPNKHSLAFLPRDTEVCENYLTEMNFCLEYANLNRNLILSRVVDALEECVDLFDIEREIHIEHNYVRLENHFGENVFVHRKGATSAKLGQEGIIPGSQGTNSYIVRGKGNKESFSSCSHGAGRLMSRTMAKQNLLLEEQKSLLDNLKIAHTIRTVKDLDEAHGAYKDIDIVMKNQEDLVSVDVKLSPLAVIKG